MIADLVSARYVSAWATVMMPGVPLGGSTAAIIARWVVPFDPDWGWRCMFLIAIAVLPSDSEKSRETQRGARFFDLLNPTYRTVTIWFLIATFVTLLAWYGLGTWLPRLMQTAGYDFGAVLLFTIALNLGAVLGSILTACAGVRYGPVKAGSFAARLAGVSLLMLLTSPSISAVYVILVLAGIGTHGTQILVIAAVADFYPSALRGTALGWALGFGRIGAVVAPTLAGVEPRGSLQLPAIRRPRPAQQPFLDRARAQAAGPASNHRARCCPLGKWGPHSVGACVCGWSEVRMVALPQQLNRRGVAHYVPATFLSGKRSWHVS